MAGSRTRLDSSRTSIAMRRLPGREGEGVGQKKEVRRRSAAEGGTHLVVYLVRGTTHRDARGATEPNHDRQGSPFGLEIPPPRSGIFWTFLIRFVHQSCRVSKRVWVYVHIEHEPVWSPSVRSPS